MYRYNIYLGMFDRDTKQQEISNQDFLNTVRKIMRYHSIDNYTIYKCKGHYKHWDDTIVCEPSINIEFIDEYYYKKTDIELIKINLCKFLNQEDVLITRTEVEIL